MANCWCCFLSDKSKNKTKTVKVAERKYSKQKQNLPDQDEGDPREPIGKPSRRGDFVNDFSSIAPTAPSTPATLPTGKTSQLPPLSSLPSLPSPANIRFVHS